MDSGNDTIMPTSVTRKSNPERHRLRVQAIERRVTARKARGLLLTAAAHLARNMKGKAWKTATPETRYGDVQAVNLLLDKAREIE